MKKKIVAGPSVMRNSFIFLLLLCSCSPPDYHKTVIGNWYNCDDGTYTEMYIDTKYFTTLSFTSLSGAIGTNTIWKYEMKGDTIFYDLIKHGDNSRFNRNRVKIISDDHIQLNSYIEDKKKESGFYDWYRLKEKPGPLDVLSLDDHLARANLKQEFRLRASGTNCKRTAH